jgi:lambda family phage tail tape measure protein
MANDRIVLEFSLNDVGDSINSSNKNAKALKSTLESIQKMSDNPGSKAKAAAFGGTMGNTGYDVARGITGQTGASGRDFANQARGLDGLVRLYATYAANLFAVSAAFRALSDAMDTTNMIQGMNQLGAQSGLALGTIAKNFAATTDGAISMREAMEATVKATSAGLSAKQLTQLGTVANNASKALGVNMSDAVSRLTRGITKLEPELLDELGIFTKVSKATEDYARSVGKTEAQLTDFEKRQAFANAVLKEGLDKFGAIQLQANPYDKLTAGLKDLAQNGLEKVNKLLVPFISALATSPTALTAAVAYLGATIVKQALPAIGQYRDALSSSANAAAAVSARRAEDAAKAFEAKRAEVENKYDQKAEQLLRAKREAAGDLAAIRDSGFTKSSQAYKIMMKDADKVTQSELDHLKKLQDQYKNMGKIEISSRYEKAIDLIKKSADAELAFAKRVKETNDALSGRAGMFDPLGMARDRAKRAADAAKGKMLVSQAAEDTQVLGARSAFEQLRTSVKESDLSPFRKMWTTLAGSISIATTAMVGFISAIQTFVFIAAAVATGFKLLDAWLTKTKETSEKFNTALEASDEAVKSYNNTMEALVKKDPSKMFAADSLLAQSNAMLALNDSLGTLVDSYEKLSGVMKDSKWDQFTNWVSKLWGGDKESKFAETSAANIAKQISAITNASDRSAMTDKVNAALGTPGGGQLAWQDALEKQGPKAASILKTLQSDFKKLGTEAANTASRSTEFNDALKKVQDSYKAFAFANRDQSPLGKLADDMLNLSSKMVGALQDPIAGLTSMKALLAESTTLGIFDPGTAGQLKTLTSEINSLAYSQGRVTQEIIASRQEVDTMQLEYDKLIQKRDAYQASANTAVSGRTRDIAQASADILSREATVLEAKLSSKLSQLDKLTAKEAENRDKIQKLMQDPVFAKLVVNAFEQGAKLTLQSINNGFAQAQVELQKGILSGLTGLPGSAALERQVGLQENSLQAALIKVQQDMIKAQYLQIAATIANTTALELQKTRDNRDPRDIRLGMADTRSGADLAANQAATDFQKISERFSDIVSSRGKGAQSFIADSSKLVEAFQAKGPQYVAQIKQMVEGARSFLETQVQLSKLDTKDKLINLEYQRKLEDEQLKINQSIVAQKKAAYDFELQSLSLIQAQNGYLDKEQLSKQKSLQDASALVDLETAQAEIANERNKYELNIAAAKKTGLDTTELEASSKLLLNGKERIAEQAYLGKLAQTAVKTKMDENKLLADEESRRLNILAILQETNNINANTTLELSKANLDYKIKNFELTDQEIANAKYLIESTSIQLETTQKLASVDLKYRQDRIKLDERLANAVGDEAKSKVQEEINAIIGRRDAELNSIKVLSDAKQRAADQDAQYTERQKAYGKVVEDAFNGMADAVVEFTKTGKLNFTSLIDNMIEGLIRYEMQLQSKALYSAARPGLMDFVGSVFGFNTNVSPQTMANSANAFNINAKGGVYDTGLKTFAQGGMFTNSIVSEPTLFKFAKGTGLMGEAGPEAIMPLKRDSNGNLGVRAGQHGSVDVVVNNYGSEKATTNETVDSRGNRKIEVVIGDMAASELARNGSASQKAIRGTFGLQPQLIRR